MAHDGTASPSFVVCRGAMRLWAIPIERVAETMRPLPTEPLAGMPPFLLGIALIRGAPVPVVHLARLVDAASDDPIGRYLTLRLGAGRQVGVAVESVVGVRPLRIDTLDAVPPLLRECQPQIVAAIKRLDADLLSVLEVSRLVPEPVWHAIEAAGAQR